MGKRNYTIAVDVDGVLADQISGILPIIIKVQGVMLKYDEVTSWNLPINDTSIDIIIVNEQKKRSYILNMPVHKGAREVLNRLNDKYYVNIATARPSDSDSWTKEWLSKNKIPYDSYYNLKEGGKQNAKESFDVLIDDYIGNIKAFLDKCEGKAILFSQPWNKDRSNLVKYINNGRLAIANNWIEIENKVKEFLKDK